MARFSSSSYSSKHGFIFHGILIPLLLLSHICFQLATCGTIVKYLPGFEGPLPFVLETGYIGVGENDDVQTFYYFIESENDPKEDPLMLWLTGGPGCSSLSGLVLEIGPIKFKKEVYNGSLPNLVLRPHSWTKVSNIIFVDLPVSTGFTYARTESSVKRSDWLTVCQAYQFLRKSLKENCKGEYINVDPKNVLCSRGIESFNEAVSEINLGHILEPLCEDIPLPPLICQSYGYYLSSYWANDDKVRKALHIRKGSIGKWRRCTRDIPQNENIPSSFEYHVNLSRKGYRSIIYSGDHDMLIPFFGTQAWIRSLKYSIVDDWRPWHTNDQVADTRELTPIK